MSWIDASGIERPLDASNGVYVEEMANAWMPSFDLIDEAVPLQPGTRLRTIVTKARQFDVTLVVAKTGADVLADFMDQMLVWFDPAAGDGRVRITQPSGRQREIAARYADGLGLDEKPGAHGAAWQRAVLTFKATDPYWRDVVDTQFFYNWLPDTTEFFDAPFLPLNLSNPYRTSITTLSNDGQLDAWPVWQITGPGSNPSIRNLTTGQSLVLAANLADSQVITIDTQPGRKTVVDQGQANYFPNLSVTSTLWPLVKGTNVVQIEMNNTGATSQVYLRYRRRYLGP